MEVGLLVEQLRVARAQDTSVLGHSILLGVGPILERRVNAFGTLVCVSATVCAHLLSPRPHPEAARKGEESENGETGDVTYTYAAFPHGSKRHP